MTAALPTWLVLQLVLAVTEPVMVLVAPDTHLAVYEAGPAGGEAVVLVPGFSGSAYGFRNLEPLLHEQGRRTVAVELLGLGLSDRTRGADYSLAAQAERLAAVLDACGVSRALVVCQGISAGIVFRLALARPELVAGILSVEGGPAETAGSPTVKNGLKLAKLVVKLGGSSVIRDRYADDLVKASGDASWVDKRTVRSYFRGPNRDLQGTLDVFLAMAETPEPVAVTPRLGEINVPVAVLVGSAEHIGGLEPAEIDALRNGLRDVTFTTISGAGHFIYEEQPETVAAAVADLAARAAGRQR